jgi:hypothetical protein
MLVERTELGKSRDEARSMTSFLVNLFETIHCAKSPTTLDEGVTLMMSPQSSLAQM